MTRTNRNKKKIEDVPNSQRMKLRTNRRRNSMTTTQNSRQKVKDNKSTIKGKMRQKRR